MILPDLQGTCNHQEFFIYTACDDQYFDEFAPAFVGSIQANTQARIHLHIFNPRSEQLEFCQKRGVTVTWEHVPLELFADCVKRWHTPPGQEPELSQYKRTLNAMSKGGDTSVIQRLQKTYYACARFMRLAQIYQQTPVLAIDIDAVIRDTIPPLALDYDFYIHYISGKRARYLAGGLWLTASDSCVMFLNKYAYELQSWFEKDYVYWGLDQDLLDPIVPKFNHGQLPIEYIDWNMQEQSYIWTAKGTRKNLPVFINAQQKYTV